MCWLLFSILYDRWFAGRLRVVVSMCFAGFALHQINGSRCAHWSPPNGGGWTPHRRLPHGFCSRIMSWISRLCWLTDVEWACFSGWSWCWRQRRLLRWCGWLKETKSENANGCKSKWVALEFSFFSIVRRLIGGVGRMAVYVGNDNDNNHALRVFSQHRVMVCLSLRRSPVNPPLFDCRMKRTSLTPANICPCLS